MSVGVALSLLAGRGKAGKLRRASEAARSGSSSHGSRGSSSHGSRGSPSDYFDGSCCASSSDEATSTLALYVVASPWLIPNMIVEAGRPPGAAGRVRFADYPYARSRSGYLLEGPPTSPPLDEWGVPVAGPAVVSAAPADAPAPRKSVAASVGLEAGIGTGDAVVRGELHASALFPYRLGLDTSWAWYREGSGEGVDQLGRGREHLDIRFAESNRVFFQTGLGAQHMADRGGWLHGFDATWGFTAFPVKPLVLSAEGSLGTLGHAFAPGARGKLGLMLDRFEVSAGFEERWVGPVALGGPFISVAAWL